MRKNHKIFLNFSKMLKEGQIPKADMHLHTNFTDGLNTVEQMHTSAEKKKLKIILFTEHSRKESGKWFFSFAKKIRKLNSKYCRALIGTEVKILNYKGDLDLSSKINNQCDFIMASVHRFPGEKNLNTTIKRYSKNKAIKIEYKLMCAALRNRKTDILGHAFGMSLKRFEAMPSKKLFIDIIKKCKQHNKIFEINSYYHSFNIKWLLSQCLKYNVKISLGSNAHQASEIGKIFKILSNVKN